MDRRKPSESRKGESSVEEAVLRYAREHPGLGQLKVAEALKKNGYAISASGVRNIWRRHDLETAYKRLKAVERAGRKHGIELTASQKQVLRRGDVSRKLARQAEPTAAGNEAAFSAERRGHILAAAAQLFSERSYEGTSIRDLGERVGLLPGSVYHYFRSKEDLFVAVHREGFRQLIERVSAGIERGRDPWEKLELACEAHVRGLVAGDAIAKITGVSMFWHHEARLQKRLKADRDAYEDIYRRLIADLDLPRYANRSLVRLFLFGAMNWTILWYHPGGLASPEIAHQLVCLVRGKFVPAKTARRG